MQMELKRVQTAEIVVGKRVREELGNIDALAKSIDAYGLIFPIVLTRGLNLVSGLRRLEACKKLAKTEVDALVLDIEDERLLFHLESEENLCRKALTPAELDREIDMKKRYAYDRVRSRTSLGRIWNRVVGLFRKKRA